MGEQGAGLRKITCYSITVSPGREATLALTGVQDNHLFCVGNIGQCCKQYCCPGVRITVASVHLKLASSSVCFLDQPTFS